MGLRQLIFGQWEMGCLMGHEVWALISSVHADQTICKDITKIIIINFKKKEKKNERNISCFYLNYTWIMFC